MCRKFEVNTLSNSGVITFCDFLSHNSRGYSMVYASANRQILLVQPVEVK